MSPNEKQPETPKSRWKERKSDFYKFEKQGDSLEGNYMGYDIVAMPRGDARRHKLDTAKGRVTFLGGVQVDPLLDELKHGTEIRVVFVGRQGTGSGQSYKQFQVFEAA